MPHHPPPDWLADRVWRLAGTPSGPPEAQLILLPSGRIGAGWGTNFARWRAASSRLVLLDASGLECVTFGLPAEPADVLHGQTVPSGEPCRLSYLRDVPILSPASSAEPPASGRSNLVILRAGPESLHPAWLHECPEGARTWDLCVCTYGAGTPESAAEHRTHYPGSKFEGLSRLLADHGFWRGYDYVWFPDDDLLTDWQTINRMFELCRAYGLALAQPSLAPGSCINHPITRRTGGGGAGLRFTSFVEIMAPIFSQPALRRLAGSFALNPSGYGLDHLWPAIIDEPPTAIAILDAVSVLHTRPIGASYDQARAMQDGWMIEDAFHQVNRYEVRGVITLRPGGHAKRHGVVLTPPATAAA